MKTRADTVSILIPVYNARPWVGRAIESALAQTWPQVEVIALDDCSTDGSWDVLQEWRDKIRVERADKNGGQNVSRNHLTRLSQGEWLVYLDADDELMPDSVEKKMAVREGAVAVYGSSEFATFKDGQKTKSVKLMAEDYDDPVAAAFAWRFPNTSAFAFQRQALLDAGGWDESMHNCTDYALYFPLLLRGGCFKAAPEAWSLYRQWSATQAVYVNGQRRTVTRQELIWRHVLALEQSGGLTEPIRSAFCDAAFLGIRTMYQLSPKMAIDEHQRLKKWCPSASPSAKHFPRSYCAGYRVLGFRGAELVAKMTRFMRPAGRPVVS